MLGCWGLVQPVNVLYVGTDIILGMTIPHCLVIIITLLLSCLTVACKNSQFYNPNHKTDPNLTLILIAIKCIK